MSNKHELLKTYATIPTEQNQRGPGSAGQSGDTQGLPDSVESGGESVLELVQEGQYFEAEVLLGIENADEDGVKEVHTKEIPQDDVPAEYLDRD